MQKEAFGEIQLTKKQNNNLTWIIIIAVLLLLIMLVLAYLGYNYFSQKIEPNETEQNYSYVNDTTPINDSKINDTLGPITYVCGDGKCNGKEDYTSCPKDCRRPDDGGGGGGGGENPTPSCTPNCAGKQCGDNGCSGTCPPGCGFGYECNSTFSCSLIPCTNDTGCSSEELLCSSDIPYNCSKNIDGDICLDRVNLTVCSSGWQCINGSGCLEIIDCTSNLNCSHMISKCSYGICNASQKCEMRFNQTTNVCRASPGVCDITEKCTGSSAACPTDSFNLSSTVCRAASGECDIEEKCTGISGICPINANKTDGSSCTGGTCQTGKCILCTNDSGCSKEGLFCSGNIPYNCAKGGDGCLDRANLVACAVGWQCIVGSGCEEIPQCNFDSDCNSLDNACSYGICNSTKRCEVRFNQTTNICSEASGTCGRAEYCTGNSAACPIDTNLSGNICRVSIGVCDIAEKCNGLTNNCPINAYNLSSDICRGASGVCDVQETCTGSSAACPSDSKSTSICMASAGVCDMAESCDGINNNCPADAFNPAGTICRASNGVCDISETCTGSSITCPTNLFNSSSTMCRASAFECDIAEMCTGSDASCPANINKSDGIGCSLDTIRCTNDTCMSGVCSHIANNSLCELWQYCDNVTGCIERMCSACSECEYFWGIGCDCNKCKNDCPTCYYDPLAGGEDCVTKEVLCSQRISSCSDYDQCECGTDICNIYEHGCTWNDSKCIPTPVCDETNISCGLYPSCENCDSKDKCVGTILTDYYCINNSKGCGNRTDNCSDCSCSCGGYKKEENRTNNNCKDGLDNDCDGLRDAMDDGCGCKNGIKDGDESDVDCGGSCGSCVLGKTCNINSDCASGSCLTGICSTPTGCKELYPGHNDAGADRVNIVFVGYQYENFSYFIKHILQAVDLNANVTAYGPGLMELQYYKDNKDKFNFWYVDKIFAPQGNPSTSCTNCYNSTSLTYCTNLSNKYQVNFCNSSFRSCAYMGGNAFNSVNYGNDWPFSFEHEFQHQFPRLLDEYIEGATDSPGQPNCADSIAQATSWWGSLEGQVSEGLTVGYYDGCSYVLGNYRPTTTSVMRTRNFLLGMVNGRRITEFLGGYTGTSLDEPPGGAIEVVLIPEGENFYKIKEMKPVKFNSGVKESEGLHELKITAGNQVFSQRFDDYDYLFVDYFINETLTGEVRKELKKEIKVTVPIGESRYDEIKDKIIVGGKEQVPSITGRAVGTRDIDEIDYTMSIETPGKEAVYLRGEQEETYEEKIVSENEIETRNQNIAILNRLKAGLYWIQKLYKLLF